MKHTMKINNIVKNPWTHIAFLTLLMVMLFWSATISPQDDSFLYQKFAETLVNEGRMDFSIPGFHGADFFTAVIYFFTRSPLSVIYLDIFFAIANIIMMFLAVREIFRNRFDGSLSTVFGVMAAYIYVLSPIEYTNALRGGHHTAMIFFALLGIYLLFKNSKWSFLPMGISYIIRPFPIALFLLFIYKKRFQQFLLGLIIPIVYVVAEYSQIGKVFIGVHSDLSLGNIFSIKRFFFNLVYAFQNYFSFHNYSFLNCLDPLDMVHLSPFIAVLALISIMFYKTFFNNKRFFITLASSGAIALILPALLYHLDMWYLWTLNFILILLSLPVIARWKKIIPIVTASFGFQFLYLFIATRVNYWARGGYVLFAVFIIIFAISVIYTLFNYKKNENSFSM